MDTFPVIIISHMGSLRDHRLEVLIMKSFFIDLQG